MTDIKWIKVQTDIFSDEKILLIESMKDADTIITIWFKLLCLAGKTNNSGSFTVHNVPYTVEMFADIFHRPLAKVKRAFEIFEKFGMIEFINDTVTIPKWSVYQNDDALSKLRNDTKERVARYRERKKDEECNDDVTQCNDDVALHVTECNGNVTVQNKRENKNIDIDIDKRESREKVHALGEFKNVVLSDDELADLKARYGEVKTNALINDFSMKLKSKGYKYVDHHAAIISWAEKDAKKEEGTKRGGDYYTEAALLIESAQGVSDRKSSG